MGEKGVSNHGPHPKAAESQGIVVLSAQYFEWVRNYLPRLVVVRVGADILKSYHCRSQRLGRPTARTCRAMLQGNVLQNTSTRGPR